MENFDEMLPYILLGTLIWAVLLYAIIAAAVKSGTKHQTHFLRMLLRMKAKQMKKQGFTYQQIKDMYEKPEEDFWKILSEDEL